MGSSSSQPSSLLPENLENDSMEIAEGDHETEAEAPGGTNSEPGTPRAGRSAIRAVGGSRAERCAGVHISDPYNVNLPLHITSILSVPPNIISNVSLTRLTRGLECPALQPRPNPASGPGPGPGPPGEDPGMLKDCARVLELQAQAVKLEDALLERQRPRALCSGVVTLSCLPGYRVGGDLLTFSSYVKTMEKGSYQVFRSLMCPRVWSASNS